MKTYLGIATLAAGLTLLTGCGDEQNEGGVTAEESRQLNEAAEMLDASPDSLVAGNEEMLGNGEQPAAETGDLMVADNAATNATGNAQ